MRKYNNNNELAPLLMTKHGHALKKKTFYSLKENRHHTTSIPTLCGKRVLGSGYGWLVLVEITNAVNAAADCCLQNPFAETREKSMIKLPRLHQSRLYGTCVLSKPPTEPDCLVVFNSSRSLIQSVCRVGDDMFIQCSSIKAKRARLMAISSFRGEIYGILDYDSMMLCEFVTIHLLLVGGAVTGVEFNPLLINGGQQNWGYPQLWRDWVTQKSSYLIESPSGGGEHLLVTKFMMSGVVEFRIFRVDLNEMTCSEELDNIDGLTIFIGHWGNGYCCASESAKTKSNSIYYIERKGRVVHVYDLDNRSTTDLLPCPVANPYKSINYWIDAAADIS